MSRLKKLNRKNLDIVFGVTLSKYNVGSFLKTYSEVKKEIPNLKLEDFHINIYHESKQNYDNINLIKDKNKYNKKLIKDINYISNLKNNKFNAVSYLEKKYLKLAEKYLKSGKCPVKCKVGSTSCFIDSSGNVFPCSNYNKKIGNIRDFNYELRKIWNSEEYAEIRKDIVLNKCPQCWTPCEAYQSII